MNTVSSFLCASWSHLTRFLRHCFTECPLHMRCSILVMSAFLNLLFITAIITSCSNTETGIAREQAIYTVSTSALGQALSGFAS